MVSFVGIVVPVLACVAPGLGAIAPRDRARPASGPAMLASC